MWQLGFRGKEIHEVVRGCFGSRGVTLLVLLVGTWPNPMGGGRGCGEAPIFSVCRLVRALDRSGMVALSDDV